ncbi:hypothetical protein ACTXJR_10805 [Glutamicibacter ardleyensis]|uniref:hypothetical protein n=1 Tax=Glutamicibacter ardleyensis TaxID=225894 RepID=UPI003FB81222
MSRRPSLSILLISALILNFSAFGSPTQALEAQNKMACQRHVWIHGENLDAENNKCKTEDEDSIKVPFYEKPDQIKQQPLHRYEVKYQDYCSIGLEQFRGCNQNPDAVLCTDGSSPYSRIITFVEGPRKGETIITHGLCPNNETPLDDLDGEVIQRIIITPRDFRSFPILESKLISTPQKFSLRNGHTHFWAEGDTQTFETVINDTSVTLRAIPDGWNWKYGDGTTRKLDFPGEPAPNHTLRDETPTSHSYKETGTYSVGLTTLFRGEFSVDGGPWQSIPGQAAVPSDPIEIDVWRTKKELIARD